MSTLAESFDEYADKPWLMDKNVQIVARRAFYAGALAAAMGDSTKDEVIAECVQFGRSIGTPAERAS